MGVAELTTAQLAYLADLIADRLRSDAAPVADVPAFVSAGELAARLGIDSKTVYRHGAELGGVKVGRVWRFDLARAVEAWSSAGDDRSGSGGSRTLKTPVGTCSTGRRRRASSASHCQLLPVGRATATGSEDGSCP